MSIDLEVRCKGIDEIVSGNDDYISVSLLDVDVEGVFKALGELDIKDIVDEIGIDEIVFVCKPDDILEVLDETDLIKFIEEAGYKVTDNE